MYYGILLEFSLISYASDEFVLLREQFGTYFHHIVIYNNWNVHFGCK